MRPSRTWGARRLGAARLERIRWFLRTGKSGGTPHVLDGLIRTFRTVRLFWPKRVGPGSGRPGGGVSLDAALSRLQSVAQALDRLKALAF